MFGNKSFLRFCKVFLQIRMKKNFHNFFMMDDLGLKSPHQANCVFLDSLNKSLAIGIVFHNI